MPHPLPIHSQIDSKGWGGWPATDVPTSAHCRAFRLPLSGGAVGVCGFTTNESIVRVRDAAKLIRRRGVIGDHSTCCAVCVHAHVWVGHLGELIVTLLDLGRRCIARQAEDAQC